jgi:hypothetical protein
MKDLVKRKISSLMDAGFEQDEENEILKTKKIIKCSQVM